MAYSCTKRCSFGVSLRSVREPGVACFEIITVLPLRSSIVEHEPAPRARSTPPTDAGQLNLGDSCRTSGDHVGTQGHMEQIWRKQGDRGPSQAERYTAALHRRRRPRPVWTGFTAASMGPSSRRGSVYILPGHNIIETQVSKYIRKNFTFVALRIESRSSRLELESRIISTVSSCRECGHSNNWLGFHSPKANICNSGLWLVNELYKNPLSQSDLYHLKAIAQVPFYPSNSGTV